MFSFLTRIVNGIQQSRALRYQSRAASIQATALRNQANAQAALIENSARRNAAIDAENLKAARANQREQIAELKNKQATTGFTAEGTATAPIRDAHAELDAEIANMALSSSINSLNAIQAASDTRSQGELSALVKDMEAQALRSQAKGIQRATVTNALTGTVAAAYGAYQGYNAESILTSQYDSGQISAADYAAGMNQLKQTSPWLRAFAQGGYYGSIAYDATAAFNPYTTTMTRKNPWGGLYSLVRGANPGITRNNYNQLFTR